MLALITTCCILFFLNLWIGAETLVMAFCAAMHHVLPTHFRCILPRKLGLGLALLQLKLLNMISTAVPRPQAVLQEAFV
jgi:hypothetical protein